MPVYKVKAYNSEGKEVTTESLYPDEASLYSELKKNKLIPISIKEKKEITFFKKDITDDEISMILFQIGTLQSKAIPLNNIIDIVITQIENNKLKGYLYNIKLDIEKGLQFSEALRRSGLFPDFLCEMIKAGESSGAMDVVLLSASKYFSSRNALKKKLVSSLIYPLIILIVGIAALIVTSIFVTPKIVSIYTSFGKPIPFSLQIISSMSKVLILIMKLSPFILLFGYVYRKKIKKMFDFNKILYSIPFINKVKYFTDINSFTEILSLLLRGGVSLENAFKMAAEVVRGSKFYNETINIAESLKLGQRLGVLLNRSSVFPDDVKRLLELGDEVGDMEKMTETIAEVYKRNAESRIQIVFAYLEPLIVIFLSVFVGLFIVGTLLPIINISLK
jgi:type IV pilus assembly protein PilC